MTSELDRMHTLARDRRIILNNKAQSNEKIRRECLRLYMLGVPVETIAGAAGLGVAMVYRHLASFQPPKEAKT